MAYDDENVDEIYIEPPESNELTDEDSADEDEGGLVDNLTARQLTARAEIVYSTNNRLGTDYNNMEEPEKVPCALEPSASTITSTLVLTAKPVMTNFIKGDLQEARREFPIENYSKYHTMSCVELFELFFPMTCYKI